MRAHSKNIIGDSMDSRIRLRKHELYGKLWAILIAIVEALILLKSVGLI